MVHIQALDQALKHGLKLKKVHRVIEFQQSRWMKAYIMLNKRLRTAPKNEFEKDFFKLMNNSIFGKTMENIRNLKNTKLVTSDKRYLKYVMKPNFKDGFPFSKHLFAVEMEKTKITMNMPVYLGQAILDLSKTIMYEFHYDYMRPKYGSKANLCYMDTDSFDYEKNHEKSAWWNQLGGKIMAEFAGLRAKMYAYRKIDKEVEEKSCKGTKNCVVSEGLTFDDYKTCLFDGKTIYREQTLFENKKHEVYTVNKHKVALNRDDDKRLVQADGMTTLARGYVAISA